VRFPAIPRARRDRTSADPAAPEERRIVLTDDFGQRIQMSVAQLRVIVDDARAGVLDELVGAAG
jgi:hypothetical protein